MSSAYVQNTGTKCKVVNGPRFAAPTGSEPDIYF